LSCSTIHSISIHQDFRRTTLLQPSETTLPINSKRARSFLPNVQKSPTRTQLIPSSKQPNMQPLTILALLVSLGLAAASPPGTGCKINLDCSKNGVPPQGTIAATSGGSYQFVRDPALTDTQQYCSSRCQNDVLSLALDVASTAAVCRNVGGMSCSIGCVTFGKVSDDTRFRSSWIAACKKAGTRNGHTDKYADIQTARERALCI
jgi:hypothetical protein